MTSADIDMLIEDGKATTKRLVKELSVAHYNWSHFEAINGIKPDCRREFRDSLVRLGHTSTIKQILFTTFNYTILTLCRISDPEQKDRLTLCRVAGLLKNSDLKVELIEIARNWTPDLYDIDPGLADENAKLCHNKIEFIENYVTSNWKSKPPVPDLFDWRNEVKPTRDGILAHILPEENIPDVIIDKIRYGMDLATTLIHASSLVFLGSSAADHGLQSRLREVNDFGSIAEAGFKNAS